MRAVANVVMSHVRERVAFRLVFFQECNSVHLSLFLHFRVEFYLFKKINYLLFPVKTLVEKSFKNDIHIIHFLVIAKIKNNLKRSESLQDLLKKYYTELNKNRNKK